MCACLRACVCVRACVCACSGVARGATGAMPLPKFVVNVFYCNELMLLR